MVEALVIRGSLNPASRSARLAKHALDGFERRGVSARDLDLREFEMPFCDGGAAYGHPSVAEIGAAIAKADVILVASPVYNFDLNAAVKNVVELTGKAWEGKVVGFMLSAGGRGSYMSPMAFAASLMLDFRSFVVPRFVYVTRADLDEEENPGPETRVRINELVRTSVRLARGLALTAEDE